MPPSESTTGRWGAPNEQSPASAESSGLAVAQCREWLGWAAAQVDACVSADKLAMDELLASLKNLMGPAVCSATTAKHDIAAIEKLSAVITAVQTHDRVMQGLAHVTDSLRALQGQLGDARQAASADAWRALRERQFRAFSMPEERTLFARMVAHEEEASREVGTVPAEAVEFFTTGHGLFES
jgi:hypothetical protein